MLVMFDDVSLQVIVKGDGPVVVLLPFLGRSVHDFDALVDQLVSAGFKTVAVNPRGIRESSAPIQHVSMDDYATDLLKVINAVGAPQVHLLGYAFGGHIARRFCLRNPTRVASVVLIGAGGSLHIVAKRYRAQFKAAAVRQFGHLEPEFLHHPSLTVRRAATTLRKIVSRSYLSPRNAPPLAFFEGWNATVAAQQLLTLENSTPGLWWHDCRVPVLVLQGADDKFAPPEHGRRLKEQIGERLTLVEVRNAGHAVLHEQPEAAWYSIQQFYSLYKFARESQNVVGEGDTIAAGAPVQTSPSVVYLRTERSSAERPAYDVAINGTSLAGTILATILARRGKRVLLIDEGIHPRFSLGESGSTAANLMLETLARRYKIAELRHIASVEQISRYVSSNCGIKRNYSYVYHREGFEQNPNECNQMAAPPFICESHLYRQDIDAYLQGIAIRYGADYAPRAIINAARVLPDRVQVQLKSGPLIEARYVVDTGSPRPVLGPLLGMQEIPTRVRYQSRAVFTHMVNVTPFDACLPSRMAGGNASPFFEGTLHHVFDGGALWVIPFNNHEHSTNLLCSVGLLLDPSRFPASSTTAEEEFFSIVNRYPALKAQFESARAVREWGNTSGRQYSMKRCIGDRVALIDAGAGWVDDLLGRGLADTLEAVSGLAPLLLAALDDNDLSARRFEVIERLQQGMLDRNDTIMNGMKLATQHYPLWNTWYRALMAALGLGEVRLVNAHLDYQLHGDLLAIDAWATASDPASFFPDNLRFKEFWEQLDGIMTQLQEKKLLPDDAEQLIQAMLLELDKKDISPPVARVGDPSTRHFDLNPLYLLQVGAWVAFQKPRSELKQTHASAFRHLLKGAFGDTGLHPMPLRQVMWRQISRWSQTIVPSKSEPSQTSPSKRE